MNESDSQPAADPADGDDRAFGVRSLRVIGVALVLLLVAAAVALVSRGSDDVTVGATDLSDDSATAGPDQGEIPARSSTSAAPVPTTTTEPSAVDQRLRMMGLADLAGMSGTQPLIELGPSFRNRLVRTAPGLTDFNFAAESYDAVVIVALATEVAGSDGSALADHLNEVTRDGTKCTAVADCLRRVRSGEDIDYDGKSGPLDFGDNGEPTTASFGVLTYGTRGCDVTILCVDRQALTYLFPTSSEEITTSDPEDSTSTSDGQSADRTGDGSLTIGTLLPVTGDLAFLGPPMRAGASLALNDVNTAGGVLGRPVGLTTADSGGDARRGARGLLADGVDAIVGPSTSDNAVRILPDAIEQGVVVVSPAATSRVLSTIPDHGLFFRTAPSDFLQAEALATVIADRDVSSLSIYAVDDAYGRYLADDLEDDLARRSITVDTTTLYDPSRDGIGEALASTKDDHQNAVVVIGSFESTQLVRGLVDRGAGPADLPFFGADANMGDAFAAQYERES